MDKGEYFKLLLTPQWKAKRAKILIRDNNACVKCGSTKRLHVHHKYYLSGKLPWQYPDEALQTLCSVCHKKEHNLKEITDFTKKNVHKTVKQINKAKAKKKAPAKVVSHKEKTIASVKEKIQRIDQKAEKKRALRRMESPIYQLQEYKHLTPLKELAMYYV